MNLIRITFNTIQINFYRLAKTHQSTIKLVKTGSEQQWRHTITWNFGAKDITIICLRNLLILSSYHLQTAFNTIQHAYISFTQSQINQTNIFWYEHVFNKREIAHGLNRHGSIAWQWIYGAEKLIDPSAGSTYVWKTLMFIIISPACSSALSWLFFPSGLLTLAGVAMFSGVQCKRTNYACA